MSTAGKASDVQWYLKQGDKQVGPVSTMQLWQLAGAGRLSAQTWVLQAGTDVWIPASKVVELPTVASQSSAQLGGRRRARSTSDSDVELGAPSARQASASSVQLGAHSSARLASSSSVQLGAHSSARLASSSSVQLGAHSSARLASSSSVQRGAPSSARMASAQRPQPAPGIVATSCPSCRAHCRIPQPKAPTAHRCPHCKRMFRAVQTTVGVVTRAVDEALNPTMHQAATNVR